MLQNLFWQEGGGGGGVWCRLPQISLKWSILFLKANPDIANKHVLLQTNSNYPESEIAATTILLSKHNAEMHVKCSLKLYT